MATIQYPSTRELLTETETADLTGLSALTLRTWRSRGGGPPYRKLGRAVRYTRADLDAWLDASIYDHSGSRPADARKTKK